MSITSQKNNTFKCNPSHFDKLYKGMHKKRFLISLTKNQKHLQFPLKTHGRDTDHEMKTIADPRWTCIIDGVQKVKMYFYVFASFLICKCQ